MEPESELVGEDLPSDIAELLQMCYRELRAIHQHVGPTCPDFTNVTNGKAAQGG